MVTDDMKPRLRIFSDEPTLLPKIINKVIKKFLNIYMKESSRQ